MWISLSNNVYLRLTTHFISDDWKMQSVCLGTLPVSEWHTGVNISSWIEKMLRKFEISTQKIVSFVHDNGSNSVQAGCILTESLNGQVQVV